ncbi:hypothetical protein ABVK25_010017 [Lepraria finkii]|uniref:HD domain-containing protein n=1 Tax=Lepraria finkii TaxID=1340010 RepID=A0ABR4AVR1_9LECA
MTDSIATHGWTAQPRDVSILLSGKKNIKSPEPVKVEFIPMPDSQLAKEVMEYAKKELREETFNHSMRVYYYGMAIKTQQFPSWRLSSETYFLTCVLHDIGTTDKNISATLMSFEFYGGLIALDLLHKTHHAPIEQAEAVTEAVIRHQDIGESGKITELGQLVQLATIFDNMGGHADLVHKETIENVVKHFPRKKWSSCFAATIRKENALKPWAHTTALEKEFPEGVEGNQLMAPYDG